MGKEAARFLSDLGEIPTSDSCAVKSAFVKMVWQELCYNDAVR